MTKLRPTCLQRQAALSQPTPPYGPSALECHGLTLRTPSPNNFDSVPPQATCFLRFAVCAHVAGQCVLCFACFFMVVLLAGCGTDERQEFRPQTVDPATRQEEIGQLTPPDRSRTDEPVEEHAAQQSPVAHPQPTDAAVLPDGESSTMLVRNSLGMEFVRVPSGEFLMGSRQDDGWAGADERPQHQVRISNPFWLGRYEVTQHQFSRVMDTNPSYFSQHGGGRPQIKDLDTSAFPVEQVDWLTATEFCKRISNLPEEVQAERVYRLPTEAEWEYACRAGTTSLWQHGEREEELSAFAWFSENADGRTHRVGRKLPNPYGIHDIHGNVWEWCSDWYSADTYRASNRADPLGPAFGIGRVIRGGGWLYDATNCRSAARDYAAPAGRYALIGVRLVCELQASSPHVPE